MKYPSPAIAPRKDSTPLQQHNLTILNPLYNLILNLTHCRKLHILISPIPMAHQINDPSPIRNFQNPIFPPSHAKLFSSPPETIANLNSGVPPPRKIPPTSTPWGPLPPGSFVKPRRVSSPRTLPGGRGRRGCRPRRLHRGRRCLHRTLAFLEGRWRCCCYCCGRRGGEEVGGGGVGRGREGERRGEGERGRERMKGRREEVI